MSSVKYVKVNFNSIIHTIITVFYCLGKYLQNITSIAHWIKNPLRRTSEHNAVEREPVRLESSIQNHAGSRSADFLSKKRKKKFIKTKNFFFLKSFETYQKKISSISDEKKIVSYIFHFLGCIKLTISQKLKIGEFFYCFSRSIQHLPHHL